MLRRVQVTTGDGTYAPTFNNKESLVFDTAKNVYRLTDLEGAVTVYNASSGAFVSQTDVAGNVIQVTVVSGNGFNPATVQRTCTVAATFLRSRAQSQAS